MRHLAHVLAPNFLHDRMASSSKGILGQRKRLGSMSKKTMSVYINNMWVHQRGHYWIAEAVAFSENDNDVTISACRYSPELAYERLIVGMKELRLFPADWDK
jgi:hypothetical protein